jgi:hypothetical protein
MLCTVVVLLPACSTAPVQLMPQRDAGTMLLIMLKANIKTAGNASWERSAVSLKQGVCFEREHNNKARALVVERTGGIMRALGSGMMHLW